MEKVQLDKNFFIPMPVTLIGSMYKGKPNFMAAGWVSRVNANPPQIGIGIHQSHATIEGIEENKTFSICFPNKDLLVKADYVGIASAKKTDKSHVFDVFYGNIKTAPMIQEAPLCIECNLVHTYKGPTNTFFIGEIQGVHAEKSLLQDGKISPKAMDYLFLTMPDNNYWSLGESVGKAWSIGKQYKA